MEKKWHEKKCIENASHGTACARARATNHLTQSISNNKCNKKTSIQINKWLTKHVYEQRFMRR